MYLAVILSTYTKQKKCKPDTHSLISAVKDLFRQKDTFNSIKYFYKCRRITGYR